MHWLRPQPMSGFVSPWARAWITRVFSVHLWSEPCVMKHELASYGLFSAGVLMIIRNP